MEKYRIRRRSLSALISKSEAYESFPVLFEPKSLSELELKADPLPKTDRCSRTHPVYRTTEVDLWRIGADGLQVRSTLVYFFFSVFLVLRSHLACQHPTRLIIEMANLCNVKERTFFDTVSRDVPFLIMRDRTFFDTVRNTSNSPRCELWRNQFGLDTLEMVFHPRSPFRNDVGVLFPVLTFGYMFESQHVKYLDFEDVVGRIPHLFEALVGSVKTISTGSLYRIGKRVLQGVQRCTRIRGLCSSGLGRCWPKLLALCAPSLETLEINGVEDAIVELELDIDFLMLKSLQLRFCYTYSLTDYGHIFKVVGRYIEEVSLDFGKLPGKEQEAALFHVVRQHCQCCEPFEPVDLQVTIVPPVGTQNFCRNMDHSCYEPISGHSVMVARQPLLFWSAVQMLCSIWIYTTATVSVLFLRWRRDLKN